MYLYIVRHGECLGQSDPDFYTDPDSPLSQLGAWQAHCAALRLREEGITHLLSSPLVRSLTTAHTIAETVGIETIDVWIELREGWDELHRGLGRATLQQRFPRLMLPPTVRDDGWDHGGDTDYQGFFARAEQAYTLIRERYQPDDRVVVVTHGGFANNLLHAILGIAPSAPQWFELANCSISRIRLVPDPAKERPDWPLYPPVAVEVLSINDVAHLTRPQPGAGA